MSFIFTALSIVATTLSKHCHNIVTKLSQYCHDCNCNCNYVIVACSNYAVPNLKGKKEKLTAYFLPTNGITSPPPRGVEILQADTWLPGIL